MIVSCGLWTDKKKTFKIGNLGRKVENKQLEEHLLTFMKNLDEAHLQFVSSLLILEALDEYPNWLGGVTAPRFIDRAHQFVQRFRERNKLVWRMPTTIGQKRPPGAEGKWFLCAEFYYIKTKGIPKKYNYNGDETKVIHEPVAKKQMAKRGVKRVHAMTTGREKEGNSVFLGTDGCGVKNRPFIILKGSQTANRPTSVTHARHKTCTIRGQIEEAKSKGLVDKWFDYWVNETGTMNEEAHLYMLERHFKRVRRENNEPTVRMSLLEDSHSSHKTKRVTMLCKQMNVQLAIIAGGLTGDAQLADRVFIKRFKKIHRAKLGVLLTQKWREAKRRQVNRDGYVFHPHLLKPAAPDRIEQINLIVQAWRETNTADIEKKTDEVKMKCHALAQETGWTPIQAFSEQVDEKGLQKELKCIRQPVLKQEAESLTGLKCITPKCGKKGLFNFSERPMPMFCEDHRYEGMIDVVCQTLKGGKDKKSTGGKGVCGNKGTVEGKPCTVQHSSVKGGISDDDFQYTGKGQGKAKSKVHGQKRKGENAKGPGRPTKAETLVREGKTHKPIQFFFHNHKSKIQNPRRH